MIIQYNCFEDFHYFVITEKLFQYPWYVQDTCSRHIVRGKNAV